VESSIGRSSSLDKRARFYPLDKESEDAKELMNFLGSSPCLLETHGVLPHEFKSLLPTRYVNDNIISKYMTLLSKRANQERNKFFDTMFYQQLKNAFSKDPQTGEYRYHPEKSAIGRMDSRNILNKEKLFLPVHCPPIHWVLVVVDMIKHTVYNVDGLSSKGIEDNVTVDRMQLVQAWLNYLHESANPGGKDRDWKFFNSVTRRPDQNDGCSCGPLTMMSADFWSDNLNPKDCYSSTDAEFFRYKIAIDILRQKIFY